MHFGRYEILQSLGVGGMGEVSLAIDRGQGEHDDKLVALKVLRPDFADDEEAVAYFTREARIVARLAHKNVVGIYRLGEDGGRYFISMEYVRGGALSALIRATRQHGPVPVGAALSAVIQLCRGAHAAHELHDPDGRMLGIVHRDITPHNVMVDERGVVRLLDFGIAIQSDDVGEDLASGKPSYLAPEQAHRIGVDRRTDIYGIGIVLWELLAGQKRLRLPDAAATMDAVRRGVAPSILDHRPELDIRIVDVLEQALSFHPRDRFETAAAFAGALQAAATSLGEDVGERGLAAVVQDFLGDALRERLSSLERIEQTLHVQRRSFDITRTVADTQHASAPVATVFSGERHALQRALPTFALGPNFEMTSDGLVATIQIWPRPDLSREEGAEAAGMILDHVRRLLSGLPELRGLVVDCRGAVGVLGSRTVALIETMFRAVATRDVRLGVLITHDPLQRLDFTEIVGRAAPAHGRVVVDEGDAWRWAG
jgi:serine/threonine-protein kinase